MFKHLRIETRWNLEIIIEIIETVEIDLIRF